MFTSIHGVHDNLEMGIQWRSNQHRLYIFICQKPAVILVDLSCRHNLQSLINGRLVDVGNGNNVNLFVFGKKFHQETSTRTWTDNTQFESFA